MGRRMNGFFEDSVDVRSYSPRLFNHRVKLPGTSEPVRILVQIPLMEFQNLHSVIISSLEGELHFVPDSSEWFDRLASFRFVGKLGRFTAYRESSRRDPTRSWRAHRRMHTRRYK